MKTLFIALLLCFGLGSACARAEGSAIEVIPLKHRTVDQVLPILRPFVARGGAINGINGQLIVRTTPANLAQLKAILRKIDTVPRRLLITVRQGAQGRAAQDEARISGSLPLGPRARISVPPDGGDGDGLHARVLGTRSLERAGDVQRLQVMEGSAAFIRIGSAMPVPSRTVVRNGRTVTVLEGTRYRDVTTAFYVRPRISGDTVTLEIAPQRDTPDARGNIALQQAHTTVSGRLGEWIEVAATGRERARQESGFSASTTDLATQRRGIFVKVEELR